MIEAAPRIKLTYAQYLELERQTDTRHEFLNGEAWAMAGGTLTHAALAGRVIFALGGMVDRERCHVYTSDAKVRVVETGLSTYPDASVVCGRPERAPDDRNALINPLVLVEVLSDGTESYDRGAKFAHYRHIPSLRAYVLVSQRERRIEVYEREAGGPWVLAEAVDTGRVEVRCLQGAFDVADIYQGVELDPAE
jgi:Uma2 family endonuclease